MKVRRVKGKVNLGDVVKIGQGAYPAYGEVIGDLGFALLGSHMYRVRYNRGPDYVHETDMAESDFEVLPTEKRVKVGSAVKLRPCGTAVVGKVVADLGPTGGDGRIVYRVRFPIFPDVEAEAEMPADKFEVV